MRFLIFLISFILSYYSAQASTLKLCSFGKVCQCSTDENFELQPYSVYKAEESLLNGFIYKCSPRLASSYTSLIPLSVQEIIPFTMELQANPEPAEMFLCGCDLNSVPVLTNGQKQLNVCNGFPNGCGYQWKSFDWWAFKKVYKQYLTKNTIICDKSYPSMCTSAVFLAFVGMMKLLKDEGKITENQFKTFTAAPGKSWTYINNLARPDTLMTDLKLGEGKILEKEDLPSDDWPKAGDLVQIWRNNKSGHSTVFTDYLYDESGKKVGICYWSSQPSTDGYGKQCESLNKINSLTIGRITI